MDAGEPGLRDLHLGFDGAAERSESFLTARLQSDALDARASFAVTAADRVRHNAACSFDASCVGVLAPLLAGRAA